MGNGKQKQGVRITATPHKLTMPGKVLTVLICVLPFLTRVFHMPVSEAAQQAYFLSSDTIVDFEQMIRQLALVVIAVLAVAWFGYERLTLRPRREIPHARLTAAAMVCMGLYLLLSLLSTVLSPYAGDCWFGIYMNYEGCAAILSYGVIFAAAWYFIDRQEVLDFVKSALTVLSLVLGALVLLERMGAGYYNNAFIQLLSGLSGDVAIADAAVLTFGNADYLGVYCAMLLPVQVSLIRRDSKISRLAVQIAAAVLVAVSLILTKVMNAVVIGFCVTLLMLLVRLLYSDTKRHCKVLCSSVCAAAVLAGCFGFVLTRSGDSFSQKLSHLLVGAEQGETFDLLSLTVDGDTLVLQNADTTWTVTAQSDTISADTLAFSCNGEAVTPHAGGSGLEFEEPALAHCTVGTEDGALQLHLGYPTPVQAMRTDGRWQVVGIGGQLLEDVPQVSTSQTVQKLYPYLNGRVFVWVNTLSVLGDCILLGHGPCTSIYYLNQNDLPALLNIYGQYVLYNKPHSWYLQMAQDTGLLSLAAVLAVLCIFLIRGFGACCGKKRGTDPFRTGVYFAVISFCLCGLFSDSLVYHAPMFWLLLGIGLRISEPDRKQAV